MLNPISPAPADNDSNAPIVSVLITTFNRSRLLRRAIQSVLMQDFTNFELVVIDDNSNDDTPDVVASFKDPRIHYIRNDVNVGAKLGDRAHVRRFVYELMRGQYFVYLCDDDYWMPRDLLSRQIYIFKNNDNVAFVMGNQLSYFLTTSDSYLGRTEGDTMTFTLDNIALYFDRATGTCKSHHLSFFPTLLSKPFLNSEQYLTEFASAPTQKNRIVGATLYSRRHFLLAGAMQTEGSKWQAGYEFLMGPACVGNVGYIDDACILTEIRAVNASFQRTQLEHYLDSIKSVEVAFSTPLKLPELAARSRSLHKIKADTIRSLSRMFMANTLSILRDHSLGMCSIENMSRPLKLKDVLQVAARNRIFPGFWPLLYGVVIEIEDLTGGYFLRLKQRLPRAPQALWRRLISLRR